MTTSEESKKKAIARQKRYYERHKEQVKQRVKEWSVKNKEYRNEYQRNYYSKNKEKINERHNKWRKNNPEHDKKMSLNKHFKKLHQVINNMLENGKDVNER